MFSTCWAIVPLAATSSTRIRAPSRVPERDREDAHAQARQEVDVVEVDDQILG